MIQVIEFFFKQGKDLSILHDMVSIMGADDLAT